MGSFRCYDNSDVIATLMMRNCHLNTTVVAIFPNVCLRRRIEPPSYARTAYVVVIWPSFLFDSFVKIWVTWKIFLGKWFTAPPGKKFPVRLCQRSSKITSASVDNTLLDLQNSSYPTQPHSIIAKYCYIGVNLSELNDMEDKVDKKA